MQKYKKAEIKQIYEDMLLIRRFEEEVFEMYKKGLMPGLAHLYMGEEAVAVGVSKALNEGDYISSTHRGHGHMLSRGADVNLMMAEILGKKHGYCHGKGGSMHIVDMSKGLLGCNGIVGGGIPHAAGAAYSAKYQNNGKIAVCFLGDGATNQGTFHETLNMASAWKLPAVFVIENNLYGITGDQRDLANIENLADRAAAYGIPGVICDGMDPFAVYEAFKPLAERARSGEGPSILEAKTYRWQGHHVGDPGTYRSRRDPDEVAKWKARCPIKMVRAMMLKNKTATEAEILEIEARVDQKIADASTFAVNDEYPPAEDAFKDNF